VAALVNVNCQSQERGKEGLALTVAESQRFIETAIFPIAACSRFLGLIGLFEGGIVALAT
jgi:hypothetical protein